MSKLNNHTQKSMVRDLTEGSVTALLLQFTFPLFISNAMQAVYNIVDMIVVGQFIGGAGMSAVSIGGDILHLLTFVAMGFSSAGQVLIAQYVGGKRMERVRDTIGTMFTFLLIVSLLIALVCLILRTQILNWLNTPPEAFDYTMDYMVTCLVGLVFIYGYNIVSAILRGMGDSRRPFIFVTIAAIINIVLDILLVAVFKWEVFGAAFATVVSQALSFVFSIVYLYRRKESFGFDFKLKSFAIKKEVLVPLVELGVPMAIQSAAVSISKIILTAWINAEGVIYSALAGIYNKINMVSGIISNSFTTSGSTMVAQNLGARKYKRVPAILRTVAICTILISTLMTLVILFWSDGVFRAFTADEAVLAESAILIMPMILNFYGSATRSVGFSIINGSGRTTLNLIVALLDGIVMRIGMAALLGFGMDLGCYGYWMGDAIAGFMPFAIGFTYYLTGRWKKIGQTASSSEPSAASQDE